MVEGSIKRRERERESQTNRKKIRYGEGGGCNSREKEQEACLKFLLELLFDRITKDETALLRDRLLEYSKMMVTYIFEQKIRDVSVDISKLPHTF